MDEIGFDSEKIEFVGFDSKPTKAKTYIMGDRLWNLLFQRDNNFGGFLVGLFGIMGSGKTSLLHTISHRIAKRNPDEILFWREPLSNPFQAANNDFSIQVLCERHYPVKAMQMHPNSLSPSDDIKIRKFTGFKELLNMVKPQTINVIYFHQLWKWIKLMDKLKYSGSWQSFFFDEFEDVVPGRCEGKQWRMNEVFANSIKEIRKARISCFYNCQNQMDMDYRVKAKTMLYFYLYGARKDEHSPIFKQAVQNLEIGQGWIDYGHSLFGLINFKPVYPKSPTYVILPTNR